MNWLAALVAFFCMGSAYALGLGEIEGSATVGRPLGIAIPILGAQVGPGQDACASLVPEGDKDGYENIRITVERSRVHLTTTRALTQPILQFRLRIGCSSPFERSFVLLPTPPGSTVAVPTAAAPVAAIAAPSVAARRESPPISANMAPAASAPPSMVLASSASLRMLSRQRYPHDSRIRVRFIRQVAAANPEVFASAEVAFDQTVAAGTRLLLPPGLPAPRRSEPSATEPAGEPRAGASRRAVTAPSAGGGPRPQAGRGRLIVGSAGLTGVAGPSAAELNESIDRLIEVMNQQVMVQIAMTERIKTVEAELAELKRRAAAESARTAKLEAELKAVRETAERGGTMQFVLLILLGGVAGAWALSWRTRRKDAAAGSPPVTVSPAPTPVPTGRARPMPSVFDDLLDSRDDILPPAGPR